jgi:ABC-2 type transport system permease protein
MRREGTPWRGLGVVTLKELSDHLSSARMRVLEWLVVLTAMAALYGAIQNIRDTTAEDPFLFLRLFTTAREPLPSFVAFMSFLVPLMAIGLGFDAVNGEHNRRTLSRILSQPIYRDALLFGKFLAALATLAISLIALWLLVIGLGLVLLGVPPGGEEMLRSLGFLGVTIVYAHARAGLSEPVARRGDGRAVAVRRKRADRLATNRRADRRDHPAVCRRLRDLPAPGSARLARKALDREDG